MGAGFSLFSPVAVALVFAFGLNLLLEANEGERGEGGIRNRETVSG